MTHEGGRLAGRTGRFVLAALVRARPLLPFAGSLPSLHVDISIAAVAEHAADWTWGRRSQTLPLWTKASNQPEASELFRIIIHSERTKRFYSAFSSAAAPWAAWPKA